jgi:AcrR family transcriptional regulator
MMSNNPQETRLLAEQAEAASASGLSKGERTAHRVVDVAEALFAQRGFDGTTLRDIADAAAISEPGLYNHFRSKDDLYRCVLERGLAPIASAIGTMASETRGLLELQRLPTTVLRLFARHPHMALLLHQALSPGGNRGGGNIVDAWLSELINGGRQLLSPVSQEHLSDDEIALRLIAMFNVTTGYFIAAPLYKQLTGKDALDEASLKLQEKILLQINKTFLLS